MAFYPKVAWSCTGGKFQYYLAISDWPDREDLEDFLYTVRLMERAMIRNESGKPHFTGFDHITMKEIQ